MGHFRAFFLTYIFSPAISKSGSRIFSRNFHGLIIIDHQPIWLFAFKQNGKRNAFPMHKEGYPFRVAFSEGAKTIHHRPQPDLYPPGFRSAFSLLDSIPPWVLSLPPECRHIIICVEIKRPS